jgi:hypothetical protein
MARTTAARITAAPPTLIPTIAPIERFDADDSPETSAAEETVLLLLADVVDDDELVVPAFVEEGVGAASVTVGLGDS